MKIDSDARMFVFPRTDRNLVILALNYLFKSAEKILYIFSNWMILF